MAKLPDHKNTEELAPTRKTLLDRLRDLGDHDSWQDFFDTYWKLIYGAAVKGGLSHHEAEDVVQETIVGVAQRMATFRYNPHECSFKGWLMHVTHRRMIDHFRKRQTHPQNFVPLEPDTDSSGAGLQIPDPAGEQAFQGIWDEEWQKNLIDVAMERVKRRVKAAHYQIFYLHSVKNMSARNIAELTGSSVAKIYVVRHRVARLVKREVQALESKVRIYPSN